MKVLGLIVIVAAGQQPAVDRLHHRAAGEHLDAVDQGPVRRPLAEVDRDLPVAVGRGRERLHHRLVLAPRRRHDVEVRQHLRAVDAHVELPLARIAVRRARRSAAAPCSSPPASGSPARS